MSEWSTLPMAPLLARLDSVASERCIAGDPAHDYLHVRRVASVGHRIALQESADTPIVVASALLHELFSYPKDHPDSPLSGEECARHARIVLESEGAPADFIDPVVYAIAVHPFSRGVTPETLEGRILQDADRLDAIGAIGVARCFATGAAMGSRFYLAQDPFCVARDPQDRLYSVDHFYRKLLHIPEFLHTDAGRREAHARIAFLKSFLCQLEAEINTDTGHRAAIDERRSR